MSETVEKTVPVKNLERIGEKKFATYLEADVARKGGFYALHKDNIEKLKIFARWDGSFDLVAYKKVGAVEAKVAAPEKASEPQEQKVHGLRSKERKKSPKKAQ